MILDPGVQNSAELRDLLLAQQEDGRDLEFFVLDANRDGVEQIAEILAQHHNLDAVHVLSHGTARECNSAARGSMPRRSTTTPRRFAGGRRAFISDADLLLYGCDLAASDAGRSLVDTLGQWTGTDVAASTDLTGNSMFGGDWELEYQTGHIETAVAASADVQLDWIGLMTVSVDSVTSGSTPNQASLTISHTTSGTNRLMLVGVSLEPEGESRTSSTEVVRRELVFVDTGAQDFEKLLEDIWSENDPSRNLDVVLLSAARDGIEQITETLAEYEVLDALHIISHGSQGRLKLGETWLDTNSIADRAGEIARWRISLGDGADLLFYGCDLAGNESGHTLLESVQALTGANVAANVDTTGATQAGDSLLQFTSSGHVLGFGQSSIMVASLDHLLRVDLVGSSAAMPVSQADAASIGGDSAGARAFSEVTYVNAWDGVTVVYDAATPGSIFESTYYVDAGIAGNAVDQIRLQYNRDVSLDAQGNLVITFDTGTMTDSAPSRGRTSTASESSSMSSTCCWATTRLGLQLATTITASNW